MYKKEMGIDGVKVGHVQGIATDRNREYMYYSCTTYLVKTDMDGNVVGTVRGLAGHLGCIAYNYDNGKVYGSLEYKHDIIGRDILSGIAVHENKNIDISDGFYIAIFDVDKIDRMDMDAEGDGIMTVVHLKEVLDDFSFEGHRYGCSGIDGITFAPIPGEKGEKSLYVSYGIYSDLEREDNDHQVILRYDISDWDRFAKPISQEAMHRFGPETCDSKYFVYTGNTTYGIQNLEYDEKTGYIFAAVYKGKKEQFPNYPMYVIDITKKAEESNLKGLDMKGETLPLAPVGELHLESGVRGINFPYGATGMISLGDGYFYFSKDFKNEDGTRGTTIGLYEFDGEGVFTER